MLIELTPAEEHSPRQNWVVAFGFAPVAVGLLALIGWSFGIEVLKSIRPGLTPMNPMTAVALICLGSAVYLHIRGRSRVAPLLGGFVAIVGGLKLAEVTLGTPGVDAILFSNGISQTSSGLGRMAPNTAAALATLGVATALVGCGERLCIVAQGLCAAVALIALFALVGYLFGVAPLHTVSTLRPMAVHTGLSLFVCAIALACVPRRGIMMILRNNGPAGALARFVFPSAVLIPIVVGAARLWGQTHGFYGTEVGVSIQVIANVTLTCCLLSAAIFITYRSDQTRLDREAALSRSQQFAQVGHVRWLAGSEVMIWSTEATRIHGLEPDLPSPTPTTWPDRIHTEDRWSFVEYVAKCATAEGEWRGRVVRPSGEVRHVRVQLTADTDEEEQIPSYFGTVSDVTDLEEARRQAETAAQAKTTFLANMSHELRTPLNGVLGFSELLLNSELDPEQREQVQTVHQSAKSLLVLLNDILDFSKIEAGALAINPEPTRLRHLLKRCLSLVEASARAKGVAVFLHVHDDVPDHVVLDGMRLRQIALNLLGNAVKFTERGYIAVEARLEPDSPNRFVVQVHDTGIGIAADRKEAIFADFVQADSTTARNYGGTGLGLSISRRLATLLGGSLELDSDPGRGTKVRLELPLQLANALESPAPAPETAAQAQSPTGTRILLVEDVEVNQRLATAMLQKMGHNVEVAEDGLEAVQRFKASPGEFHLILMDVQLPHMDGDEATRQIRQLGDHGATIPIVGLSANAYSSDIAACLEAGMNGYLSKPFTMKDLFNAVRKWAPPGGQILPLDLPTQTTLERMFTEQVVTVAEQVSRLREALADGTAGEIEELISQVKTASHKLSGTAASFGRADLGKVAAQVEHALGDLQSGPECKGNLDSTKDLADQFAVLLEAAAA